MIRVVGKDPARDLYIVIKVRIVDYMLISQAGNSHCDLSWKTQLKALGGNSFKEAVFMGPDSYINTR